jgi:hypothetical protein
MSDDKKKRKADGKRISLNERYEVRYLCDTLGVKRDELAQAIKEVGPMAKRVRAFLKKWRLRS